MQRLAARTVARSAVRQATMRGTSMTFFASRRVAVCGGRFGLGPEGAAFCRTIGEQLGLNPNIVLLNRGIKRGDKSTTAPDDYGTEYYVISGAVSHIAPEHREARIETCVNTQGTDELFFEGRILPARGRSSQARRFNFISRADALIAVSGTNGTEQQLALANALDLPVMPIPTFGGAARAFWHAHREEICDRLRLEAARAERLQESPPSAGLAKEFTSVLLAALERRC